MKNLKQYLEEKNQNLSMGIRYIESALSSLYTLSEYLKKDKKIQDGIDRKIQYIKETLLKASGFFGLYEYVGNPSNGTLQENINMSINSLNKILTAYNDGLDDPISFGKTCLDIIASLTNSARE